MVNGEISVFINSGLDVINARQKCKWLAEEVGFHPSDVTLLSTVVSELARKAIALQCTGNIVIQSLQLAGKKGISISVLQAPAGNREEPDGERGKTSLPNRRNRFSTDDRLLLLASRHFADEFEVRSTRKDGSVVKIVKWL